MDHQIQLEEIRFVDVCSLNDIETISIVPPEKENIDVTTKNNDSVGDTKTDGKRPLRSNFRPQRETELLSNDPFSDTKNETLTFSNGYELHTTTKIKEETIDPDLYKEESVSNTLEIKHNKCSETDIKMEIKKEQQWLEGNSTETSYIDDEIKDGTDEGIPSAQSSRLCRAVSVDSSNDSSLLYAEASVKNTSFSYGKDCVESEGQEDDDTEIRTVEKHVISEQSDKCSDIGEICTKSLLTNKGQRSYKCKICEKQFTQLSSLKQHNLIHVGKKPHKCEICEKSFTQVSNLKRHYLIHKGKKLHKCEICEMRFTWVGNLKAHNLTHKSKKAYKCEICEKEFTRLSNLERHIFLHEGIKPHKCEICEKSFSLFSSLKQHNLIHEGKKPYKCEICEKKFTRLSSLKLHNLMHKSKKLHKCEICETNFTGLNALKLHHLVHEGKQPYKCEICDKKFIYLSGLRTHSLIHEGVKPHKCGLCEKSFTQMSNLKLHNLIHENKRPHRCEICDKNFTQLSSWKLHNLMHEDEAHCKSQE